MDQRTLTLEQVAERLQVHVQTVRKLVKTGKLRAVKVGRVYRVREADFLEFLAGGIEHGR